MRNTYLFFVYIILYSVFCKTNAQENVFYGDNFIVFEAEDTNSPLTKWTIRKPGDAEYQKYVTTSTGIEPIFDSYLQYTGSWQQNTATRPINDNTRLEYKFTCPKTGSYRLIMRMHQPLTDGEKGDAKNDVFVKMAGNFTSETKTKTKADLEKDHKFWGRGVNKWGSCHKVEIGSHYELVYGFTQGEEYTLTMSGRSGKACIDYILFYEYSSQPEIPQGEDPAKFFPSNMRPGLGLAAPEKVTITPDTSNIRVGATLFLSTSWEPVNAKKGLQWISTDESILTVDDAGTVTAQGTIGEQAKIIATSTEDATIADTCVITIVDWFENPVQAVTIEAINSNLVVGSSTTLSVTIEPLDADNLLVNWSSSNEEVATVDAGGKVSALSSGSTTIKATSQASDTIFDEVIIQVEKLLSPSVDYDDASKYKDNTFNVGEPFAVSVDYQAANFHHVTEARLWLRHMNSSWGVVNDYEAVIPNGIIGSSSGQMNVAIETTGAIATKDLPSGDFYFLFVKFTFSDGKTLNKGLNPIQMVEAPSSVEDLQTPKKVSIYPNPASQQITVTNNSGIQKQLSIYNLQGKLCYSSLLNKAQTINTLTFTPGIYLIKSQSGNEIDVQKIQITD